MDEVKQNNSGNSALTALDNLRRRLLDLTARNRLINFRHTKTSSLRVIDELPDQLVETLLAETEIRFIPVPEPTQEQLNETGYIKIDEKSRQEIRLRKNPNAEDWALYLGLETSYEVPIPSGTNSVQKHTDRAMQTLLFLYEMEARLRSLCQKAESVIEETGSNILYLTFGFLEWFEVNNSSSAHIAPLFLVPVRLKKGQLNRETKAYEYTLSYSGEDIIPNLSLREKLRVDFALELPDLDESTRPEVYFEAVLEVIRNNQPRWQLHRYITLALLNFSKLLMYLDLDPDRWPKERQITQHPVVARFLSGFGSDQNDEKNEALGFEGEYPIDELEDIHNKYPLIDDADSSQHSALIDAVNGKNLVIEGPPGTGKSQTITNLIAAAMAQGKKVLFVAEKLAALEVVKRRLDTAGIGNFCLELHSHKSQKRKVLDEVDESLKKKGRYRKPSDIEADITRFEELKKALKDHVELINQSWKNTTKTPHEIFMSATRYREALGVNPEKFHPDSYNGDNFNPITQRRSKDLVVAFTNVYKAIEAQLDCGTLHQHPWYGVQNSKLQIFDSDRVMMALTSWQNSLANLNFLESYLAEVLGCEPSAVPDSLADLEQLTLDLERLPTLQSDELLDTLPMLKGDVLKKVKKYLKLFDLIQTWHITLSNKVGSEALNDLSLVDRLLKGSKQLQGLVGDSIELSVIAEAIQKLTRLQENLIQIQGLVSHIQASIGDAAVGRHFNSSLSGLRELKTFVELVSSLPPEYWKFRNNLFDNDELDEVLPRIRHEQEALYRLREELVNFYNLERLPNQESLEKLQEIISAGGALRWFKASWWTAKKRLLSYAANTHIKFSELTSRLGKVVTFVGQCRRFDDNSTYRTLLGVHAKGLDTNLVLIESLRGWYRLVRKAYGVGFGPKVTLGNAVLALPSEIGKTIRSLSDRGFVEHLQNILEDMTHLKIIFSRFTILQNDESYLVGEEGVIGTLLTVLDKTMRECRPLTSDKKITVSELVKRIKALGSLRDAVAIWQKANLDSRVFGGKLGLQIGLNKNNDLGIAAAKHTLRIATYLDQEIKTSLVTMRVYAKPDITTIDSLRSAGTRLRSVMEKHSTKYVAFEELVALDRKAWTNTCKERIPNLIERNAKALAHVRALHNWLDYVRERDRLITIGLGRIADAVEKGEVSFEKVEDAFYAGIYDLLAREILQEVPELGRFSGRSHEALQRQFKGYDDRLKKLQCERIAWKIDQTPVPSGNIGSRVGEYTERVLLEHECGKKKRHLPIRKLVERASGALIALKPCFMMSPMSVAQYLAPGQIEFDIVVMDEASQIKPEDALGAVARGKQLVVVGDPKQLPPTSFFDRVLDDEEEDLTAIEESESILDATLPVFSLRRLRWHYRSQHESLIAFSNHSFYEDDLILFPSPQRNRDNYGVRFSRVHRGCFVNRRNIEESKIISEAVREHFLHRSNETLGVVAMSAEQRNQIETAIEALAKEDFAFQNLLEKDQSRQESLFLKNLENVQGDERDVIFISMTYGPQEPGGKVLQRFGPINLDTGWRRLNVLFTRARKRMHIFSSMGSEDIIVGPHSRRGVKALREFLAYAETGVLHQTDQVTGRGPDSDFEIAVAQALRREGFKCEPQVGVAGFFIDIAVVDPGNPGRYLMGIECDGATYHSAKSVRDRDRLRQEILENLGWRIRRIWSTDWFKNPEAEIQPIIRELHDLKTIHPVTFESNVLSEAEKIVEIIEKREAYESSIDQFISKTVSLKEKLIQFDHEIIRKELPDIPENARLLRPAMLEAFLEHLPVNKSEFLERIPLYLRQPTHPKEGKFLDNILEIINSGAEEIAE